MQKLNKQGGKRKGAGRKHAPYKTKTVAFRVKIEYVDRLKQLVKAAVAEWLANNG